MKILFPNVTNDPYVLMDNEYFLYNFQKRLFSLISEDSTLEIIANAKSTYHIEILDFGSKKFSRITFILVDTVIDPRMLLAGSICVCLLSSLRLRNFPLYLYRCLLSLTIPMRSKTL